MEEEPLGLRRAACRSHATCLLGGSFSQGAPCGVQPPGWKLVTANRHLCGCSFTTLRLTTDKPAAPELNDHAGGLLSVSGPRIRAGGRRIRRSTVSCWEAPRTRPGAQRRPAGGQERRGQLEDLHSAFGIRGAQQHTAVRNGGQREWGRV